MYYTIFPFICLWECTLGPYNLAVMNSAATNMVVWVFYLLKKLHTDFHSVMLAFLSILIIIC